MKNSGSSFRGGIAYFYDNMDFASFIASPVVFPGRYEDEAPLFHRDTAAPLVLCER